MPAVQNQKRGCPKRVPDLHRGFGLETIFSAINRNCGLREVLVAVTPQEAGSKVDWDFWIPGQDLNDRKRCEGF